MVSTIHLYKVCRIRIVDTILVCSGLVWLGWVWSGLVRRGWSGLVWSGLVWFDLGVSGWVWLILVGGWGGNH